MNAEEKSSNHINSITLDLENLQQKYSNLLIKYKQSVTDYINYLNFESQQPCANYSADSKNINQKCYDYIWKKAGCPTTGFVNANTTWAQSQTLNGLIYDSFLWATLTDSQRRQGCYGTSTDYSKATEPNYNINVKPFVKLQNSAYMGTGSAGKSNANSLETCEAECANNSKCTGATFVSGKCNIRIGDSPIIPTSNESYAIIPKGKQLVMNMNDLNNQLININKQIAKKIKTKSPVYNNFVQQNNKISQELKIHYKELENERENIKKLLDEYETLDTTENENQIKITKNYYSYILLFILVIVSIFLLIKITLPTKSTTEPVIQYGGKINTTSYYALFFIVLLVIVIKIYR